MVLRRQVRQRSHLLLSRIHVWHLGHPRFRDLPKLFSVPTFGEWRSVLYLFFISITPTNSCRIWIQFYGKLHVSTTNPPATS